LRGVLQLLGCPQARAAGTGIGPDFLAARLHDVRGEVVHDSSTVPVLKMPFDDTIFQ
jgi:hypothetical protein